MMRKRRRRNESERLLLLLLLLLWLLLWDIVVVDSKIMDFVVVTEWNMVLVLCYVFKTGKLGASFNFNLEMRRVGRN